MTNNPSEYTIDDYLNKKKELLNLKHKTQNELIKLQNDINIVDIKLRTLCPHTNTVYEREPGPYGEKWQRCLKCNLEF
tara:strand:- start:1964 stop:2197 length:234 start_codon:yes stop_codon:yes gene_type:complete